MTRWWAALIALAGAVILAIVATTPPGPASSDASATAFSAIRAMTDVRVVGRAPHPTGSHEDAQVRSYLIARLKGMGLEVATATGTMSPQAKKRLDGWRKIVAPAPPLTNIVAILPGRDRAQPAVLLMAHHDSVWGSPAAADDGAGVASVLETIRAIKAGGQPRRDVMVLLTDGEELGLEGAKAFFATDPRRAHVGVIVNLETRGGGGRATMFETGSDNGAMMDLFGSAVRRPVSTSLSVFIYKKLPNSTDLTVAKKLGYPGFNFAFIGRAGLYHSPLATPDALDQGALQDMGRQTLDLTRALADAPVLPGRAADRTFFDAYGLAFVSYPAALGWLFLVIGGLGYGAAAWRRATAGEVAKGAGMLLALIVVAMAGLYIVNGISGAWGKVNYYDRLAAIPRLQVQALLVCLAAFLTVRRWLPSRVGSIAGAAIPLLALGVVMQAVAQIASYPFAVPLMLGGVALAIDRYAGRSIGIAATIVAAMLGVGYMLGFGFFLLQAVGPGMPMIAASPLAISAVLLLPLMPEPRRALTMAAALLVVATGIALWVLLDPVAPSVAVYSDVKK
ncbi:M28 family peptidase [Sphingomonas asaccharolytica]|uniref:M28 family peptidase n=1 Tax=Sphingomonas asaccharolytica TaxID=40681 RepID=UPI0008353E23|nr:M28 family peptidase [Sphingomonas asaccharolytica]